MMQLRAISNNCQHVLLKYIINNFISQVSDSIGAPGKIVVEFTSKLFHINARLKQTELQVIRVTQALL